MRSKAFSVPFGLILVFAPAALSGNKCIYHDSPFGLGTGYRLDSIVSKPVFPDTVKIKWVYEYDSSQNPVSSKGVGRTFTDVNGNLQDIVETQQYVLQGSILKEVGSDQITLKYLNQAFQDDSVKISLDSGQSFHTTSRKRRSGDSVYSEFTEWTTQAAITLDVFHHQEDWIESFVLIDDRYEPLRDCKPLGDSCLCLNYMAPEFPRFTYVVENGVYQGNHAVKYYWRAIDAASLPKGRIGRQGALVTVKGRFTVDGKKVSDYSESRSKRTVQMPRRTPKR